MESKKDSVQKEIFAASAMTTVSVERKHDRPLLLEDRRRKMTETVLEKGSLPEAVVFHEGKTQKWADITLKETVRTKPQSYVEETDGIGWSGRTDIISWPCTLGMYSTWMQIERKNYWGIQKDVRITNLCWRNSRVTWSELTRKQSLGLMTWFMRRNEWKEIVSWQIKRLSNCTKSLLHAWTTISSERKNWKRLENCQNYALKSSWNDYVWPECVDLTFFGLLTNLHELWACDRRSLRSCMIKDNIAMWETRHSIVDGVYSKTQTLLEALKTLNLPRWILCILARRTFVPTSWMCKK